MLRFLGYGAFSRTCPIGPGGTRPWTKSRDRSAWGVASPSTPQPNGPLQFQMTEEFTGLMAPLITRSVPDLQPSFEEFAKCLKKAAE